MATRDGKEATFEMIEYNGQDARLYPDGAIRNEKGHFLAKHPKGATITSENASELRARAIQQRQEAAAYGIANSIQKNKGLQYPVGPVDAWVLAAEQVTDGLFSDKYRDRTDAMRVLADITPSKYDKTMQIQQQSAPEQAQINLVAVFLQQISDEESAIDAEIVEEDEG
ncbi:MAG: hypothetical protein GY755_15585 [Chloroflexi bacterium]|nr:hypothetical protein [Chloroflexota bacterium]